MAFRSNILVAAFAAVTLGACATAPASAGGFAASNTDGVLDELPSHPPAGTCYARVKVVSEAPPPGSRAVWRKNPGLPGTMGPTWCLVLEDGQIAPPPPEKFGWVKVLCDTDATPDRVRHIQSKLHARGDYAGAESGEYDQATADAVARFQQEQHIDHGGYLSLQTVEAIERAEVRQAAATGGPIHVACCQAPPPPPPAPVRIEVPAPYPVRVEVPVPQPYPVRVEVRVPVPYPVRVEVPVPQPYPVYIQPQQPPCCQAPPRPQPCCVAPPQPQPCCQRGYGPGPTYGQGPGYQPTIGRDGGGWLSWSGKSTF